VFDIKNTNIVADGQEYVLIRLKGSSAIDWTTVEHAKVTSVSGVNVTLTRTCGHALSWSGSAIEDVYIAPHAHYWTWPLGTLMVNLSNQTPTNSNGQTGLEWYTEYYTNAWECMLGLNEFRTQFDGNSGPHCYIPEARGANALQADGARWRPGQGGRGQLIPVDADNDGMEDDGYINGIQEWGIGFNSLLGNLVTRLSAAQGSPVAITADSSRADWGYRGSDISGIEIENFNEELNGLNSSLHDPFSSHFTMLKYWSEISSGDGMQSYPQSKISTGTFSTARLFASTKAVTNADGVEFRVPDPSAPPLSQLTPAESEANAPFRVGIAASLVLGLPHSYLIDDGASGTQYFGIFPWDEYTGGKLRSSHFIKTLDWLGKPTSVAKQETRQLSSTSVLSLSTASTTSNSCTSASMKISKTGYQVHTKSSCAVPLVDDAGITIPVHLTSFLSRPAHTIGFSASGVSYSGADKRALRIKLQYDDGTSVYQDMLVDNQRRSYLLSFNQNANSSGQYRQVTSLSFLSGEEYGYVELANVSISFGSADRWARDFENGAVVLNMTPVPWTVNLKATFGFTAPLYRLDGETDPIINDGSILDGSGTTITVPAYDAIVLQRK
jgi:hypothetical protein